MTHLLDTYALVWWIRTDARLSTTAHGTIASANSHIFVSIVSAWEIAIKVGQGKWTEAEDLLKHFPKPVSGDPTAELRTAIEQALPALTEGAQKGNKDNTALYVAAIRSMLSASSIYY